MFFLFLITICVPLSQGFISTGTVCKDQNDCVSCVAHNGLPGENCRWCPRDNNCYASGSVAFKPCSRAENIVNKNDCGSIVSANYDPAVAYKMVFLSALAYADNITTYIPEATEVKTFRLVRQVTKPCSGYAKCSGYTAMSHVEKAIVVAFRGTENPKQLIDECRRMLTEPKVSFQAGGKVQGYFYEVFLLIWQDLKSEVYQLISQHPSYKIWVTGHSLGGAMASLASTLIAYNGKTTKNNSILYTFGQPRVGNYDYASIHDKLVPISFRVTHYRDPVVHLPPCKKAFLVPSCLKIGGGPYHHGNEIFYGSDIMIKSSSFKMCKGLPHNEDLDCSNNVKVWVQCFLPTDFFKCVNEHNIYFGISVGHWWEKH